MNIFILIASLAFSVWILRNALFWVGLWQVKEYRLDRVTTHLLETAQGKNLLFSRLLALKILTVFSYLFVVFHQSFLPFFQLSVACIFVFEALLVAREIIWKRLKRPAPTVKAIGITLLTLTIIGVLYYFRFFEYSLWLLLLDFSLPFFIGFLVTVSSVPTELYRDILIAKAARKIRKSKKLLVIGVTGSYGKSSTKEYIAQILQHNFAVVRTQGTNNTPIGITNTILQKLQKSTEIFIAEMGAYKRGEIAELCRIANPKIGVLTAVSHQHLSLFGSLAETMETKYELIESLPENGLALFNGNNENAQTLYKKTKKKKILYKWASAFNRKEADILAFNVKAEKTMLQFDVWVKDRVLHMETPLIGIHNVENILPGIFLASHLGVSDTDIKKAVASLAPLPKTMNYVRSKIGATFIDDTFNASPDAVSAALAYMKMYKKKKILVLEPMIELGREGGAEHENIGREIGKVCDTLLLTKKNFYNEIKKGIQEESGKTTVIVTSVPGIIEYIRKNVGKGDLVVFEGKEAGVSLQKLL